MYSEDEPGQHWVRKLIERLCFRCGDYHIFVSDATHEAWQRRIGFSDPRSTTIFNGMAPPDYSGFDRTAYRGQFCDDPDGTVILGICARLHHMKGHLLLLEAFARLIGAGTRRQRARSGESEEEADRINGIASTRRASNVQLLVAGDGPEREKIERRIEELDLNDNVRLLGHRSDPCEFTASLDLHVMPSLSIETIGYANIEAMFAGVPCIVSDTGGMKEIVGGSGGGVVVPADDVDALADAMRRFIGDGELRRSAGARGREFANRELTARAMVNQTLAVYRLLCKDPDHG